MHKRVLFREKFHLGHIRLLFPNLHFVWLTTKNKLNIESDRMLDLYKKRLRWNELMKPQKKMTHTFFIAVNNFKLRLKPSHRTILQTCRLSPSDKEISPFWFISPRLTVSANNFPVFGNFSDAPRQNSSSQIFRNTPTCFVFCDCLFKKIL